MIADTYNDYINPNQSNIRVNLVHNTDKSYAFLLSFSLCIFVSFFLLKIMFQSLDTREDLFPDKLSPFSFNKSRNFFTVNVWILSKFKSTIFTSAIVTKVNKQLSNLTGAVHHRYQIEAII